MGWFVLGAWPWVFLGPSGWCVGGVGFVRVPSGPSVVVVATKIFLKLFATCVTTKCVTLS